MIKNKVIFKIKPRKEKLFKFYVGTSFVCYAVYQKYLIEIDCLFNLIYIIGFNIEKSDYYYQKNSFQCSYENYNINISFSENVDLLYIYITVDNNYKYFRHITTDDNGLENINYFINLLKDTFSKEIRQYKIKNILY